MLIPSYIPAKPFAMASLSRRVNANSQRMTMAEIMPYKLIKKGEC